MSQDIGNLLERAAGVQQSASQRMTQDVHARVRQAGASIGFADGAPNNAGCHCRVCRRHMPNKDPPAGDFRPLISEVIRDGSASGLRQRQNVNPPRLGLSDAHGARRPVDVVQIQRDDLAAAKAQIDEASHDRVAP